jgi:hypothetical protein
MKSPQIISHSILVILLISSCIPKQPEQGEPGSSALVFRLQYMVENNSATGVVDTIYPSSKSDSLTLILTGRFRAYLGDEEKLNMDILYSGDLSYSLREIPCANYAGSSYDVLASGDTLIHSYRSGGVIFWKIPMWEEDSHNIDECNTFGWFDAERIDY